MSDSIPNYESCSREALLDVLNHIDRESYPERVTEIERILKDEQWLARDKLRTQAQKERNKIHLNEKLCIPVIIFTLVILGLRLCGFIFPNASIWESFNENNLGYLIPIGIILLFLINTFLNYRDEKTTSKQKQKRMR